MDNILNSESILTRLKNEAEKFSLPERRLATLERLVEACNILENGFKNVSKNQSKLTSQRIIYKINPSNIEKVVRDRGWSGPTRSFIASSESGLLDYVKSREDERVLKHGDIAKKNSSDLEFLGRIDDVELRQMVRREIERRKYAEQELKLIKEGLRKWPQVDVRSLMKNRITAESIDSGIALPCEEPSSLAIEKIRNFLVRLSKNDLRSMGLKRLEGDVVSMRNAPVAMKEELLAIAEVSNLPKSILEQE